MQYDVIVIGGGHAGCEAAAAAARLGARVVLCAIKKGRIAEMSCNPAIGGLAKGQLVKEIDALGGVMGAVTDRSAIQYRILNASKGAAVRSSRAQCDKAVYAAEMQDWLSGVPRLDVLEAEVSEILVEGDSAQGVRLSDGVEIRGRAVVVATGTFLRGVIHRGFEKSEGGREGDPPSKALGVSLDRLGFKLRRLKTGTPPRLDRGSIDYYKVELQPGDEKPRAFSFFHKPDKFPLLRQLPCHIAYTNVRTHEIIARNFSRSPLFTGVIEGIGPRYCPSIEDKVKRFRDRERHQVFLEPVGLESIEVYPGGISTSLPVDVQEEFVRSIEGLENARFVRYGYAIEYDCIDPRVLGATLESKDIKGLFFAGQINGTSGYEEAAAQGLVAGANAGIRVRGGDPFSISRDEGYIGVMIDDLIVRGADEPYRMFTSRAEHRLLLREDNADLRLSEKAYRVGLLGEDLFRRVEVKARAIEKWKSELDKFQMPPGGVVKDWFESKGLVAPRDRLSAGVVMRRPEVGWDSLCEMGFPGVEAAAEIAEQVEIQVKYDGYIRRDLELLAGVRKSEQQRVPRDIDFDQVPGLSAEIRGRFRATRPETIGQASRMPGITPAAVASLVIFMKTRYSRKD